MIYRMSRQPRLPIQVFLASRHLVDHQLVCELDIRREPQPFITANFQMLDRGGTRWWRHV